MNEKSSDLEHCGIVETSGLTNWVSAPTMPAKKDCNGMWTDRRMCFDYRMVNAKTYADRYGLPLPEQLFQAIGNCGFLSKLDLRAGFHQMPIAEEDRHKTTFCISLFS